MQSKLSFNPGSGRDRTFSQTIIQRNDRKDVMHLVSPFRSELDNEMQELIVFLKLFFQRTFFKRSFCNTAKYLKPSFRCVVKFIYR